MRKIEQRFTGLGFSSPALAGCIASISLILGVLALLGAMILYLQGSL